MSQKFFERPWSQGFQPPLSLSGSSISLAQPIPARTRTRKSHGGLRDVMVCWQLAFLMEIHDFSIELHSFRCKIHDCSRVLRYLFLLACAAAQDAGADADSAVPRRTARRGLATSSRLTPVASTAVKLELAASLRKDVAALRACRCECRARTASRTTSAAPASRATASSARTRRCASPGA